MIQQSHHYNRSTKFWLTETGGSSTRPVVPVDGTPRPACDTLRSALPNYLR